MQYCIEDVAVLISKIEHMFSDDMGALGRVVAMNERKKGQSNIDMIVFEKTDKELDYAGLIVEMVGKIHDRKLLKRIYNLAEYLYINYESGK